MASLVQSKISSVQASTMCRSKERSYTGCIECKRRKVKCDERQPICGQCTRISRECSGSTLHRPVRWSDKHEKLMGPRNVRDQQKASRNTVSGAKLKDRSAASSAESISPDDDTLSSKSAKNKIRKRTLQPVVSSQSLNNGKTSESITSPVVSATDLLQIHKLYFPASTSAGHIMECPSFPIESWLNHNDLVSTTDVFVSNTALDDGIWDDVVAATFAPSSCNSLEFPLHGKSLSTIIGSDLVPPNDFLGRPNAINNIVEPNDMNDDYTIYDDNYEMGSDFLGFFENDYPAGQLTQMILQPALESNILVEYYFTRVCALFSTFDSDLNPFRLFVKEKWQASELICYTIQSMAAACLSDRSPHMRRQAEKYQALAVSCLQEELKRSEASVSVEALFGLLLLGLSACWHDHKAFGLEHLKSAQAAVFKISLADDVYTSEMHIFFTKALIYWEMVTSPIMGNNLIDTHSRQIRTIQESSTAPQKPMWLVCKRVAPHPWTGISSTIQVILGQVLKNVKLYMAFRQAPTLTHSDLSRMTQLLRDAETLEEEAWSLHLPKVEEIDDFGDTGTPAAHYLLLAEGYVLSCLYQIYVTFPEILEARRSRFYNPTTDQKPSKKSYWSDLLTLPSADHLKVPEIFGQFAVLRIAQLPKSSGTRILQCLPLLIAASSLRIPVGIDVPSKQHAEQIVEARSFIITSIGDDQPLTPLTQRNCLGKVCKRIFEDLDEGKDVRWMELTMSLDAMTVFG